MPRRRRLRLARRTGRRRVAVRRTGRSRRAGTGDGVLPAHAGAARVRSARSSCAGCERRAGRPGFGARPRALAHRDLHAGARHRHRDRAGLRGGCARLRASAATGECAVRARRCACNGFRRRQRVLPLHAVHRLGPAPRAGCVAARGVVPRFPRVRFRTVHGRAGCRAMAGRRGCADARPRGDLPHALLSRRAASTLPHAPPGKVRACMQSGGSMRFPCTRQGTPMDRRTLLKTTLLGASALALGPAFARAGRTSDVEARLAALERRHGGRLGVAILDTGNGRRHGHRADERFLMCSTHKLLTVGPVLARVDRGGERLDRRVVFGRDVVLSWAPVTSKQVGAPGMSVAGLCEAAITVSDNTADNLLLRSLGGPPAVTAFARKLGDPLTRLDRYEPELNVGAPGDLRDTTTPDAMLGDLHALLLGNVLSAASRDRLAAWMRATGTGLDKTGSGAHDETNDVAIFWPPQRKPLLVTAYLAGSTADAAGRSAVLAEAG